MPQFDAASVVTSNPYCVIGKEFLYFSEIREFDSKSVPPE
jgi:hypothetical protein